MEYYHRNYFFVADNVGHIYCCLLYTSPCSAHSLNLVGVHAADLSPQAQSFFGIVNRLFVLFLIFYFKMGNFKEACADFLKIPE